jgi:hypothetical protein
VGNIAYANVKPEVAAQIDELLKGEAQLGMPACPVKNIADAAVYPTACARPRGAGPIRFLGIIRTSTSTSLSM